MNAGEQVDPPFAPHLDPYKSFEEWARQRNREFFKVQALALFKED